MQVTKPHRQLVRTAQILLQHKVPLRPQIIAAHPASTSSPSPTHRSPRAPKPRIASASRPFHALPASRMSDADYEAFLNKANQDSSGSGGQAQSQSAGYGTKSVDTAVPQALKSVDATYTSDADEPFEPVALGYEGGAISSQELKKLLGHGGEVEELSVGKWDPKGQYGSVVDAVKKVVDGEVKVFRVGLSGAREEYYVVGVKEGKLLGLKALSVES